MMDNDDEHTHAHREREKKKAVLFLSHCSIHVVDDVQVFFYQQINRLCKKKTKTKIKSLAKAH